MAASGSGINTAAGSAVFIAFDPVANAPLFCELTTLAEYQAIGTDPAVNDWVKVGLVEDIGEFGDEAGTTTFTAIDDRRERTLKTTFSPGTMTVTAGDSSVDQGQQLLRQALASDLNVPIRVDLADQITNAGTPTQSFNFGLVTSERRNVGNVDNVVRRSFPIAFNGEFFEVPAT